MFLKSGICSWSLSTYSQSSNKELLNFQKLGPLGCIRFSDFKCNVMADWSDSGKLTMLQNCTSEERSFQIRKKSTWTWVLWDYLLHVDCSISGLRWRKIADKSYYYTSDSLWKIWLVESIQSIHNSLWTWHDKCIICCR